ncbi:MAG: DNA polymerase III subunit gamma/tau [Chitinophagaceae bacterium]
MEKFIVSARKYRPQTFNTVVGQEHITTTLKNAIITEHLAHAFLFCGPRGVGKTTCARILAKTINCENSADGEACDVCHSCVSFNEGTSLNIHELDAASNNSVDDIRSLVEQVRFTPQAGKYKVYIIDEVHMLSSSAFNAFLKTLEEPPSYAIFILATTEKHKILPTILSRCQIFDFKRISLQNTVDHLQGIALKEQIETEETALQLISQKSEGCMRDALSILDKIVSFTNGQVTYSNTIEHLNILDADYYFKLTACMLEQDLAGAMLLYDDINKKGFEGDDVLNGFAEFLRNVLICTDDRVVSLLEVVESFKKRYASLAKKMEAGYLVSALNILNESEIHYRSARNKKLHVELALIKLCYLKQALQLTAVHGAVEKTSLAANAKPVSFRALAPVRVKEAVSAQKNEFPSAAISQPEEAVLILETPTPAPHSTPAQATEAPKKLAASKKISSLQAIREQFNLEVPEGRGTATALEASTLQSAWEAYITQLKDLKNPAWQSFSLAELRIKDTCHFEATASNNLQQKFLELERNRACEYLQQTLGNRALQFSILLVDSPEEKKEAYAPLSSREQFQKMAQDFPLVKELKDRLRLELDY